MQTHDYDKYIGTWALSLEGLAKHKIMREEGAPRWQLTAICSRHIIISLSRSTKYPETLRDALHCKNCVRREGYSGQLCVEA